MRAINISKYSIRVCHALKASWHSTGPFSNWQSKLGFKKRLLLGTLKAADIALTPFYPDGKRLENIRDAIITPECIQIPKMGINELYSAFSKYMLNELNSKLSKRRTFTMARGLSYLSKSRIKPGTRIKFSQPASLAELIGCLQTLSSSGVEIEVRRIRGSNIWLATKGDALSVPDFGSAFGSLFDIVIHNHPLVEGFAQPSAGDLFREHVDNKGKKTIYYVVGRKGMANYCLKDKILSNGLPYQYAASDIQSFFNSPTDNAPAAGPTVRHAIELALHKAGAEYKPIAWDEVTWEHFSPIDFDPEAFMRSPDPANRYVAFSLLKTIPSRTLPHLEQIARFANDPVEELQAFALDLLHAHRSFETKPFIMQFTHSQFAAVAEQATRYLEPLE